MPVYNGEKYLEETINSVLNQSYKNFEFIIVNDGSRDSSMQVVNKYSGNKQVKIYEKENTGVAHTRNFALTKCKGDYVAFIDQDDLWEKDYLENQINTLEVNNADIIYSNGKVIDKNGEFIRELYTSSYFHEDTLLKLITHNYIMSPTQVVSKLKIVKKVGGFYEPKNGSGPDDWGLWLRLKINNEKIVYNKSKLVNYRLHDSNNSYNRLAMEEAKLELIVDIFKIANIENNYKNKKLSDLYLNLALINSSEKSYTKMINYLKESIKLNLFSIFDKRIVKIPLNLLNIKKYN